MKLCAITTVICLLALPLGATTVWDEGVDGDLSNDPAIPTTLVFSVGSNVVSGNVIESNNPMGDRDFIHFTIPSGYMLVGLNLDIWGSDNRGFCAFNSGLTSYIPSVATDANFLAGILPGPTLVGNDLMPVFVSGAVTINSLPAPSLGPGDYCFVVQQTTGIFQSYSFDFIVTGTVPTEESSWGKIKSLYQ